VLYSLRHAALTQVGKVGANAFTIMRIGGSRGYRLGVHASSETVSLAIV
jgi:hypothetical protein